MSNAGTVLVTGGSGFIGGWCVIGALAQGYSVRTTLRDLKRESEVRATLSKAAPDAAKPERLKFFAANLTSDAGWDAATEGCDYVLHVASPLGVAEPKNPDEGAKRAVAAAIKAGVKRVVLTSSVAATNKGDRAAWELIKSSGGKTTLATVNPSLVLAPVLSRDFSDSVQAIQRLLSGKVPGLPRLGFNIVDARDVADLHLRAMTAANAGGERFIAANQFAWSSEIAALLKARLGADAAKVPTRKVPDFVLRLAGLFDPQLRGVTPNLGKKHDYTSVKAQRLLGWKPRAMEETVIDCAKSLIAGGLV